MPEKLYTLSLYFATSFSSYPNILRLGRHHMGKLRLNADKTN